MTLRPARTHEWRNGKQPFLAQTGRRTEIRLPAAEDDALLKKTCGGACKSNAVGSHDVSLLILYE
jgi:hypothetical protein